MLAAGQQNAVVSEVALVKFGNATASLLAEACGAVITPKLLCIMWLEAQAQQARNFKASYEKKTANRAAEGQLTPDLGSLLSDVACSGAIGCFLFLRCLVLFEPRRCLGAS